LFFAHIGTLVVTLAVLLRLVVLLLLLLLKVCIDETLGFCHFAAEHGICGTVADGPKCTSV